MVSIIRVRYVASGMSVMNSTKNLKTIVGFKLNDGNLFPGQILRRVFTSGRWEMWQTSCISSIRTTYIYKLGMELKLVSGTAYRKPKDRL